MPTGIFKRTKEHRENISKAKLGKRRKPFSEEWKRNIGLAQKGRKRKPFSREHKTKLSLAMKGRVAWNKGKHPEYMQGKNHPRWGKHWDKKHKEHLSKVNTGYKHTSEAKIKMSKNHPDTSGNRNPMYKDGKSKCKGYIMILMPKHPFAQKSGYIFEHRVVKEKEIGRFLTPIEVIHHINKIRDDNRPENLMLFENESKHLSFENPKHKH